MSAAVMSYDLSPLAKEMENRERTRERLRDAAPAMLKALERIAAMAAEHGPLDDILDEARAAIAKAEGTS